MKYRAVVFDWAGTMVDFGSFAPVDAFRQAFAAIGLEISDAQAREPMGLAKRDHIKAIFQMDDVSDRFAATHKRAPQETDIDYVYDVFLPLNENIAGQYAELVPGAADMISELRKRGVKIGSTTGYTRSIMQHVLPVAAAQGYVPDNLVCSDEVTSGRPGPDAMRKCFEDLGVEEPASVIKVDDTEPGIGEGKSAGCLAVGVSLSGNFAGKTVLDLDRLDEFSIGQIRSIATEKLKSAGADFVVDTVADLPALIDQLES